MLAPELLLGSRDAGDDAREAASVARMSADGMAGELAICEACGQRMVIGASCVDGTITVAGVAYRRVPASDFEAGRGGCHDCGVGPRQFHHTGCDMESCPRCRGQLLGCSCIGDTDPDPVYDVSEVDA
jgi:hypothetical protein